MNRYREIRQFRKSLDVVTNWIHYPIATYFCALLSYTSITPNMITILSILSELVAIYLIINDFSNYLILIVILLQLGWILDLADGMMARFKRIGFYDPEKPSNKGYYLDAVSDHVLKFMIIGALGYQLSKTHEYGWEIGMLALIIHAITQTEHTLRKFITKSAQSTQLSIDRRFKDYIALLMNNIYVFYLIFIPINRVDLLLIIFTGIELSLFLKRVAYFWINEF